MTTARDIIKKAMQKIGVLVKQERYAFLMV
jgi:hypothetical protein